jgi:hypothetical protein
LDKSNNEGNNNNNNKNNNQGTNDGSSNTGADNNLQAAEPANAKTDEQQQQQGTGESIAPSGSATPSPQPTCEQRTNCTDQQGLSDHDRSTTDTTTEQDNTPFVLSLPFP